MKAMLGSKYGYMVNGKWDIGHPAPVADDPYLWLNFGTSSGSVRVIASNQQSTVLNSIEEMKINDTTVTKAATLNLSSGDIVKIKFNTPNVIPPYLCYNLTTLRRIEHWPETGAPVVCGSYYEDLHSRGDSRCFSGCSNLEYISDCRYGFKFLGNDLFAGSKSNTITGSMTIAEDAVHMDQYVFGNFGNYKVYYNATRLSEKLRTSSYGTNSYPTWYGSGPQVYIGNSVEYIPSYFFTGTAVFYIKNPTPPELNTTGNTGSRPIHVPSSLVDTYKAAWPSQVNNIIGDYND